jgi:hypothetical protein
MYCCKKSDSLADPIFDHCPELGASVAKSFCSGASCVDCCAAALPLGAEHAMSCSDCPWGKEGDAAWVTYAACIGACGTGAGGGGGAGVGGG